MKRVLVAAHSAEAQLVKGLLEASGIQAEVRNEELFSVLTGILAVQPEVWITHDSQIEPALAIVESCRQAGGQPSQVPYRTWKCLACGEEIESQFTSCWRCGQPAPDSVSCSPVDARHQ
jgi:hypothetical protein